MTKALFIAWRSGGSNGARWGPVGRLEHGDAGYRFVYTKGARTLEGFSPFPGMSDLDAVYESDELFPLFANRLLARTRPEYEAFLAWGGFDPNNPPDPIAELSVTEGKRETDSFEVFPCPTPDADGFVTKFFLHGLRYIPAAAIARVNDLKRGERLGFMLDVSNPYDRHAVAVRTFDSDNRFLIGYVPRYLAQDIGWICEFCGRDLIGLVVERVNANAPLQQRLLCRVDSCWPPDFEPCKGGDFEPIATHEGSVTP
jgi:hypothetical protein